MRLCTFIDPRGASALGALLPGERIVDVMVAGRALGVDLPGHLDLQTLISAVPSAWTSVRHIVDEMSSAADQIEGIHRQADVPFSYPYRPAANIVKAGGNARRTNGVEIPDSVDLLRYHTKSPSACAPSGATVSWRESLTREVYVEPQLVIALGSPLYFAEPDEALAAVVGYSVGLDFRAWDLMQKHGQWPKAISLDGFFPWGPFLVTSDEVANPDSLEVTLDLNGERVLTGSTTDVLLSVGAFLSQVSQGMQLRTGDLFLLGVPESVGFGQDPPRWCRDGDLLLGQIDGIGVVTAGVEVRTT